MQTNEHRREQMRRYREANRERLLEYDRQRGAVRNGVITYAHQSPEYYRKWYAANAEAKKAAVRARRDALRTAVFGHYGESCACCGSTERLTIDHVNGDGEQHRMVLFGRSQGVGGTEFYRWLIDQDFPEGYQTLCRPCNASKQSGARCVIAHRVLEEVRTP